MPLPNSLTYALEELRIDICAGLDDERNFMLSIDELIRSAAHDLDDEDEDEDTVMEFNADMDTEKDLSKQRLIYISSVYARINNGLLRLCRLLRQAKGIRLLSGLDTYGHDAISEARCLLDKEFQIQIHPSHWAHIETCGHIAAIASSLSRGDKLPTPLPASNETVSHIHSRSIMRTHHNDICVKQGVPEYVLATGERLFGEIFGALLDQ